MIKVLQKDKQTRKIIQKYEKKKFILKNINMNFNFFNLIRWNSYINLKFLPSKNSKTFLTNKCIETVHKKKFNKLTNFSRIVFLRLVKTRAINSVYKSSW